MAIKEVKLSKEIESEAQRYNEKTGWVRLYFNTDNGYIWAEDTNDCPKANHCTYDMNKNIIPAFEKGKDGCGCGCSGGAITGEDVVKKCNEILASL